MLKDRVSINLNLRSAITFENVTSTSHKLAVSGDEESRAIKLAGGNTIDNQDFMLCYSLAGKQPQASLLLHKEDKQSTFSLLIEPPEVPRTADITRREMVFVLDTSGSMHGLPTQVSQVFMRHAFKTMRPTDYFRIIRFANQADEFSPVALPASPQNIADGINCVNNITASGGTEILSGFRPAYAAPEHRNVLRVVVFLSDGYVSNEAEILRLVSKSVGRGRLYAFGVGAAVTAI